VANPGIPAKIQSRNRNLSLVNIFGAVLTVFYKSRVHPGIPRGQLSRLLKRFDKERSFFRKMIFHLKLNHD
jgi:hypothetical protein